MPSGHQFAALRAKKRKAGPTSDATGGKSSSSTRKVAKFRNATPATLNWKNINLPAELGFDEDGGLLELDEIDDVDVVYEDGRVQFKVKEDDDEAPPAKKSKKAQGKQVATDQDESQVDESPFPDEELFYPEEELNLSGSEDESKRSGKGDKMEVEVEKEEIAKPEKPKKEKGKKGKKRLAQEAAYEAPAPVDESPIDVATLLPNWKDIALAPPLYRALHELNFEQPTAIQEQALALEIGSTVPSKKKEEKAVREEDEDEGDDEEDDTIEAEEDGEWGGISNDAVPSEFHTPERPTDRDIVGVAQTGSGKTLAYGLPILSHILRQASAASKRSASPAPSEGSEDLSPYPETTLSALILCPTRELALQVRASLFAVAVRTLPLLPETETTAKFSEEDPRKRQKGKLVNVVALTGGMSVDKQKRQLEKGADIIVATPGRLWDLIGESDNLVREIKGMKFLVIDEADRMIENGHFAELENIVRLTKRKANESESTFVDDFKSTRSVDLVTAREDMRTFVFSATMSKELQRNVKRKPGWKRWVPKGVDEDSMSSLDDLLERLDFRDPSPEIIDLTPEHGLVSTLKECKVECLVNEKDIYLYHFLIRYPARTIVFLASIDGIRRLNPLLVLLGLNVIPIHSGMQQRQRLKALDRFKSSPTAILLATDVAARGLDIPSVSHVVHYQLPRSADTYVHRSGRTARAGQSGLALQLVAPEEKDTQRMLMAGLGKPVELPALPIDFSILDQLKKRVELAKKIDSAHHKATKEAHDDKWLRDAAEALEIDLDDDEFNSDNDAPQVQTKKQRNKALAQARDLKAELQRMLKKPLMMRGVSAKYLTGRNTVGLIDQLVSGTGHAQLLGVESSTALDDLAKPSRDPRQRKKDEQAAKKAAAKANRSTEDSE